MKKKILFLTNLPSPYRVCFFSELGKLCDLTVIYERHSASDRDEAWKATADITYKEIYLKGKNISNDNSLCLDVLSYLRKNTYDEVIIGVYSTFTAILAILFMNFHKIKFSISSDGGFVKEDSGLAYKTKKYLIGSADKWYSTGKATDEYLTHYGADANKIVRYPFTSLYSEDILDHPPTKEEKKLIRAKLGITEEKMVLYVGQFIHRKGVDILLDTVEKFTPDAGFYLVGGKEALINCNNQENNNVHFLEFMQKNELSDYYKAADLFVLPTREDVWGLVVNEAMAYGLPVVTTEKCIAGSELVNSTNGRIVQANNALELAAAIKDILSDDSKRQQMAQASICKIKTYNFKNMAVAYIDS